MLVRRFNMSNLKGNINFLKDRIPILYDIFMNESPIFELNVTEIENGNLIIEIEEKRCFLHSVYDTNEEVIRMFEDVEKDIDTLVIFGLGMGHSFSYIKDNFKNLSHLIIIEPSLQIFRHALNVIEINKELKAIPKISFIVNRDVHQCINFLKTLLKETPKFPVVYHFNYRHLFADYYSSLIEQLVKAVRNQQVSTTTIGLSAYQWLENYLTNFKETSIPVENITSLFKNRSAIIVSAGPSLNKNIHLIDDLKKHAIVIAVGSAIKILDSHNIVPHFRMALDGLPREEKILEGIKVEDAPLIYGSKLYTKILPKYKQQKIRLIESTDFIGRYLYKKSGINYLNISVGPSVATIALSFLIEAGCNHIIFMGQDLSHSTENTHASGTNNLNKDNKKQFANYIKTKDIHGNDVYTRNNYLTVKYSLEQLISKEPHIRFTNASEGGLEVIGAANRTAKVVLKELINETKSDVCSAVISHDILEGSKEYQNKIERSLELLNDEIVELYNLNEEKLKYLKKINKLIERNLNLNRLNNDLKYIDNFDKKINELTLYRDAIYPGLSSIYDVIKINSRYSGRDELENITSSFRISYKISIELKKYLATALKILNKG